MFMRVLPCTAASQPELNQSFTNLGAHVKAQVCAWFWQAFLPVRTWNKPVGITQMGDTPTPGIYAKHDPVLMAEPCSEAVRPPSLINGCFDFNPLPEVCRWLKIPFPLRPVPKPRSSALLLPVGACQRRAPILRRLLQRLWLELKQRYGSF